ncbi:MAG TPA: tryptophan synthase subunit alpha [Steroidobacteraceae bacterium]|nr:tryptophan synthase subunit alpha [Steroidobacteraceae bacterium]
MIAPGATISEAIRKATSAGRPALVGWVTAGFPRRETFLEQLAAIADASDVVEIGVPFTDPMADGPTIQRASRAALAQGVSLRWILSELSGARPQTRVPLLLMSYLNPLLAYGLDRLPDDAARAGITGFIVPDLPFEECADVRDALAARGIALVQLVTPVTPTDRIQMLSAASSGFIYAVTMTGTTGKNVALPPEALEYFARVKRVSPLPVCAGFGIRSREQVERLAPHVDGVVVASALIEVQERGGDPAQFLRSLRTPD